MINIETINVALLSVVSITNLVLGAIILRYAKNNRAQKWFVGVIVSVVAWTIVNYFADHVTNHFWSLIWTKGTFATTTFLALFLLLFAIEFGRGKNISRRTIALLFLPNLIIQGLLFTPYIVKDITRYDGGVNVIFGGYDMLFTVYFLGYAVTSIGFLIWRYRATEDKRLKYQIMNMLLGLGLFLVAATITNYIIPLVFNYFYASVFGPYFSIIFIGLTTHAILRHKLLGINILAPQLFTFFIGAILFVEIFLAPDITQLVIRTLIFAWYIALAYLLIRAVRREAELGDKIEMTNADLEAALKTKDEFLQIASHQLRTPVSVMYGVMDTLKLTDNSLDEQQRQQFINSAFIKAKKLGQVVDDVLSATEMNAPDFNIGKTAKLVNLREIAQKAVELQVDEAANHKLTLTLEAAEPRPMVMASEAFLPQAISNLIDNSIKYTPEGGLIRVRVSIEGGNAVLAVTDTGMGVPPDDLGKLWDKFKRGKNAKDMHTDGSGLGLFIIKKIVEGHEGGSVFAESELGNGSTFGFKLPVMKNNTKD